MVVGVGGDRSKIIKEGVALSVVDASHAKLDGFGPEVKCVRKIHQEIIGRGDLLHAALESQRRAFTAQSAVITAINARLRNRINLYLALGGDFDAARQTTETASE